MKKFYTYFVIAVLALFCLPMVAKSENKENPASIFAPGLIWNHNESGVRMADDGAREFSDNLYGYHFDGSTMEKDGKIYHFYMNGNNDTVAAIREEGKKVFLTSKPQYKGEILLYDFGAKVNDVFLTAGCPNEHDPWMDLTEVRVIRADTINVHGISRRRLFLSESYSDEAIYCVVEGIGMKTGMFHLPQCGPITSSIFYSDYSIVNVTDGDGNVIFDHSDFYLPESGVEEVAMPENGLLKDTRKYDLFGRQIENPARGTIYIQAGRKFVAK